MGGLRWTESRSMVGVIRDVIDELAVPLYAAGGFSSLTLANNAAEHIGRLANGRPVRILYIGDWDPAGVLIDEKVLEELRGHLPHLDIAEHRLAITAEQAAELPSKPRKCGEKRRPDILRTVEAEAMPADALRALLRRTAEAYLPPRALEITKPVEAQEQQSILGDGRGGPAIGRAGRRRSAGRLIPRLPASAAPAGAGGARPQGRCRPAVGVTAPATARPVKRLRLEALPAASPTSATTSRPQGGDNETLYIYSCSLPASIGISRRSTRCTGHHMQPKDDRAPSGSDGPHAPSGNTGPLRSALSVMILTTSRIQPGKLGWAMRILQSGRP